MGERNEEIEKERKLKEKAKLYIILGTCTAQNTKFCRKCIKKILKGAVCNIVLHERCDGITITYNGMKNIDTNTFVERNNKIRAITQHNGEETRERTKIKRKEMTETVRRIEEKRKHVSN